MRKVARFIRKRFQAIKRTVVVAKTIPAPVGGWNARDPLADMSPLDAVGLVNIFPRVSDCAVRGGAANHATGFLAQPKTLALYTPPTAVNKMFAANNSGYFDVTSAGAIGATVAALTDGYCNWTQMGVSGGHYLLSFNGVDKPWYYDGTTWIAIDGASVPAITGVTTTLLISANVYKRRLFLIEKGKLAFRYLTAADAVGGVASEFLLGPLCQKGGYCMAMGTWSIDGGNGPDDYAVFITSEGEAVVFTGTDPGSVNTWTLVGVFQLAAKPLGRKCLMKYGGDLVYISEAGAVVLSKALLSVAIDYKSALTDKIRNAFTIAANAYGGNAGWEGIPFPAQNAILFNVPVANGLTYEQYVMNTITKSWCKFSGWNGSAFAVFNKELYFADVNKVSKAWTGFGDYGVNTTADAQTSYNFFLDLERAKHWKLVRPQISTDGNITFALGLSVDYRPVTGLNAASYSVTTGAHWDVDLWDAGSWSGGLEIQQNWSTIAALEGYCASMLVRFTTMGIEIQWISTEFVYERGGILG